MPTVDRANKILVRPDAESIFLKHVRATTLHLRSVFFDQFTPDREYVFYGPQRSEKDKMADSALKIQETNGRFQHLPYLVEGLPSSAPVFFMAGLATRTLDPCNVSMKELVSG